MIQCPNCNATCLEGTLFCEKCGTALRADLSNDGRPTGPLPDELAYQGEPGAVPATLPDDLAEVPPGSFALWITNSNRRQIFEMDKEILIGRRDSANRVFPDLDLTADGGFERGISRRHSRITFRDGVPYVEDLKSTNRTYLNNMRLRPLVLYPLRHGDELLLGAMVLRVELPWLGTEREE